MSYECKPSKDSSLFRSYPYFHRVVLVASGWCSVISDFENLFDPSEVRTPTSSTEVGVLGEI